ncbi:MAG TPA: hypothetical protein VMU36_11425 [Spirochaetia bacterium]|nr:hypothetical protein [Spirochaetia bacterium]
MRKASLLCIVVAVLLSSCIGIDSRLTIQDNGSGTLTLTYRVSQLVVNLGSPVEAKNVVPLPLSRADFDRSLEAANGKVRLAKFDRSEDAKDVTIRAELAFDSLEALAKLSAFRGADIHAGTDGDNYTFSQLIAKAPREPIADDSLRMVDAFFGGYDLTFRVEAPKPVKSNTLGTLSDDKRILTYKTSIKDLVRAKSDVVLSMTW